MPDPARHRHRLARPRRRIRLPRLSRPVTATLGLATVITASLVALAVYAPNTTPAGFHGTGSVTVTTAATAAPGPSADPLTLTSSAAAHITTAPPMPRHHHTPATSPAPHRTPTTPTTGEPTR